MDVLRGARLIPGCSGAVGERAPPLCSVEKPRGPAVPKAVEHGPTVLSRGHRQQAFPWVQAGLTPGTSENLSEFLLLERLVCKATG